MLQDSKQDTCEIVELDTSMKVKGSKLFQHLQMCG